MRVLDRIFRRKSVGPISGLSPEQEFVKASCPHVALVAHWDVVADMGNEDKASRFDCSGCGGNFTPDEARELRATEVERIRGGL